MLHSRHLALPFTLIALGFAATGRADPRFVLTGAFTPAAANSWSNAISADGSTVVGRDRSPAGQEAIRWTAGGGLVGLGDLPGGQYKSEARAVSGDGSVVVGQANSATGQEAFRWTASGGLARLAAFPNADAPSAAYGISRDGRVIVGSASAGGVLPFATRWNSAGQIETLGGLPGGRGSEAYGVSDNGNVVVGLAYNAQHNQEAFRWTAETGLVSLGYMGSDTSSRASAVSADGTVITGWSGSQAYRWTAATGMVGLGYLPSGRGSDLSTATAISADGNYIVGGANGSRASAFLWDAQNGIQDLNEIMRASGVDLGDWHLDYAGSITVLGDTALVTGYAVDQVGGTGSQAYIAAVKLPVPPTAVPEPATLAFLGLGALGLLRRRKRS